MIAQFLTKIYQYQGEIRFADKLIIFAYYQFRIREKNWISFVSISQKISGENSGKPCKINLHHQWMNLKNV